MKQHYCPVDKTTISYEGECNWCGEKEMDINQLNRAYAEQYAKDHKLEERYTKPRELSDEEIYEIFEQLNGEIKNFARAILKKAREK